jgi:TetR/AcrR family acrAB operon transcriptional repressor
MARKTKEEANQTRRQLIAAARAVFHHNGVARSTLEQVAAEAGVTRGAVYWHFKNKAELFFAMREDVFVPMCERVDAILFSPDFADPLDAIEASLKEFFLVLDECPTLRQVLEIMVLRCENVDEFAGVQTEADRPAEEFRQNLKKAYTNAAARGSLRPGLEPAALALDTWAFATGLLHALLTRRFEQTLRKQVGAMIATHMTLRRPL